MLDWWWPFAQMHRKLGNGSKLLKGMDHLHHQEFKILKTGPWTLNLKEECHMLLWNKQNHLPRDAASHSRWSESVKKKYFKVAIKIP
jgi:hypothetical protein